MKSIIQPLALCTVFSAVISANAAVTYTVDPSATWQGFMTVFDKGTPGYGAAALGGYQFGIGWGTSDLRATFSGPNLSLQANTIGDPNPYWYTPTGGPGAVGNKMMDASISQQFTGSLAGQSVTFTGEVLSNSLAGGPLDAGGFGWTSVAFIKDFAPDFSSSITTAVTLTPGVFSVNYTAINDSARHIQFGFQTIGPNVWAGDPLTAPAVVITAIPEPTSMALVGLSAALLVRRRRQR